MIFPSQIYRIASPRRQTSSYIALTVIAWSVFAFSPSTAGAADAVPGPVPVPVDAVAALPSTWCRFVPERLDDFAWENDLVAFRAYGPAIKASGEGEDSGIDCWLKRVKYPVVDKWYAGDKKGISYHKDHGEGYDPYHVGGSRGCGGLAIWKDGQMIRSGPYKTWKIISREPQKSVFELTYRYHIGDDVITEVKRVTIELGQQLIHLQSTFTKAGQPVPLDIAIGVTTHDGRAVATLNREKGWMSCWEKIDGFGLGTGVVKAPSNISAMSEIKSKIPDASHALLMTKTDAAGMVDYYAGFAWEKAGAITTSEAWQKYLALQTATLPAKADNK